MTERTVFECDVTGREARNRNVMDEVMVIWSSEEWAAPKERTYHIHMEEALDLLEDDDEVEYGNKSVAGDLSIDRYCIRDGDVVGAIGRNTRKIAKTRDNHLEEHFIPREDFGGYEKIITRLIENDLLP